MPNHVSSTTNHEIRTWLIGKWPSSFCMFHSIKILIKPNQDALMYTRHQLRLATKLPEGKERMVSQLFFLLLLLLLLFSLFSYWFMREICRRFTAFTRHFRVSFEGSRGSKLGPKIVHCRRAKPAPSTIWRRSSRWRAGTVVYYYIFLLLSRGNPHCWFGVGGTVPGVWLVWLLLSRFADSII